jgi:hypothetical protein
MVYVKETRKPTGMYCKLPENNHPLQCSYHQTNIDRTIASQYLDQVVKYPNGLAGSDMLV